MKKLLFGAAITLAFIGCNSDEPLPQLSDDSQNKTSDILDGYRSRQEVIDLAQQYADMLNHSGAKSRGAHRVVDESRVFAISDFKSRSFCDANGMPLVYIVEYSDDNGFAIVSAPKEAEPVLAVIDHGSYSDSIADQIPAFRLYMDMALEYVNAVATQVRVPKDDSIVGIDTSGTIGGIKYPPGTLPLTETKHVHDTTYRKYVEPVVVQNRGQSVPEGLLCSNGLSGCVPTAILMVCEYMKSPANITLTYNNSNEVLQLPWDAISTITSGRPSYDVSAGEAIIAKFERQVGHLANAKYVTGKTHVTPDNARKTLIKLLPNKTVSKISDFDFNSVLDVLLNKGIVMCMGTSTDSNGSSNGHAWIADGIEYLCTSDRTYTRELGKTEWKLFRELSSDRKMVHFNWGYVDNFNGFFYLDNIKYTYHDDATDKDVTVSYMTEPITYISIK